MLLLGVGGNALIGAYIGFFISLPGAFWRWCQQGTERPIGKRLVQLAVLMLPIALPVFAFCFHVRPWESATDRAHRLCRTFAGLNADEVDKFIERMRRGDPEAYNTPICGWLGPIDDLKSCAKCVSAIFDAVKE
ncbi:MAG: hypothetical protein WBE26_16180 [Phycisphaerae bacterium]